MVAFSDPESIGVGEPSPVSELLGSTVLPASCSTGLNSASRSISWCRRSASRSATEATQRDRPGSSERGLPWGATIPRGPAWFLRLLHSCPGLQRSTQTQRSGRKGYPEAHRDQIPGLLCSQLWADATLWILTRKTRGSTARCFDLTALEFGGYRPDRHESIRCSES